MANTIGKLIILAFWLAAAWNLAAPFPGQASTWVNWIALALLIAHSIECVVFSRQIKAHHADNLIVGYLMVMLFGVLHSGQWMKSKSEAA